MRWILRTLALMAVLGAPQGVLAQDNPVLVELYTSQGCSSCPPADELLAKLAARDDVIALAFHVDYWDYIGWKDDFAAPEYTKRQKAYAQAAGHRSVYTPQTIIGGKDHVVGYKPMELFDLINAHRAKRSNAKIKLTRSSNNKDEVRIEIDPVALDRPAVLQLVRYEPSEAVKIGRGENAGRTIKYANIVTELIKLRVWDGSTKLSIRAIAPGNRPVVVVLQGDNAGPVVASARLK